MHSLGIGNDFDKKLIEQCGKLGKGTSSFVRDLEKIDEVVIDVLNKGLRPYITDIKFDFENHQDEIASNIIKVNPSNNFTYQNEIMNYSFILPGKKELSDIKIKITGKDPINLIEADVTFDNSIKLNDGEEMSKVIIGKALNNNEELTKNEENEIKFAKKYQILSKNTALFAEFINNESQQSKLIKVELNKYKKRGDDDLDDLVYGSRYLGLNNKINNINDAFSSKVGCAARPIKHYAVKCSAMPRKMGKKKSLGFNFNIFGGLKNIFSSKEKKKSSNIKSKAKETKISPPKKDELFAVESNNDFDMDEGDNDNDDDLYNIAPSNIINNSYNSSSSSNSISNNNNNNKNNNNDDLTNLILSQNVIEGSWDENDQTKKVINIITLDIFDKIKNKIIALNKGTSENKIIFTILVVYYLKTKFANKLSQYRLVINKANKFLNKNGIYYDKIVSGI